MYRNILVALITLATLAMVPAPLLAHCDTVDGPVVIAAKLALEKGDVTPVLKWIAPADEKEIRTAFTQTVAARKSESARVIADQWFYETVVRVHRASEGEPFTGVKPAGTPVAPIIQLAEKAISAKSLNELEKPLFAHIHKVLQQRYDALMAAKALAEKDVEHGRAYVEAYVAYMHLAEQIHAPLETKGHAHGDAPVQAKAHGHE